MTTSASAENTIVTPRLLSGNWPAQPDVPAPASISPIAAADPSSSRPQRAFGPTLSTPPFAPALASAQALPISPVAPVAPATPAWPAAQSPMGLPMGLPASGVPPFAMMPRPPARESRFARWKRRNAPKYWWKILLVGLVTFMLADVRVGIDRHLTLLPLVILLGSAVVPVTFVVYLWERGVFASVAKPLVGLAFLSGAVIGLILAISAEDTFLDTIPLLTVPVVGMLAIGVIEESAKALSLIWFASDRREGRELDGLVLGAAAGMGFATLETAGYGLTMFVGGFQLQLKASASGGSPFLVGLLLMTLTLLIRMASAVFGHGVWTAILCAAIWRDRRGSAVRLTWSVALAFGISVALHAVWDGVSFSGLPGLLVFALYPVIGFAGLWILRFFIREALDRAALGNAAPQPRPLAKALASYLIHPRRRPLAQSIPAQPSAARPQLQAQPMPFVAAPTL